MNKKHFERVERIIKYLEQKLTSNESLTLKRKEILDIIGISEGDSAKAIFKILNEHKDFYIDRISYEKQGKGIHVFSLAKNNINNIMHLESALEIKNCLEISKNKFLAVLSGENIARLWKEQIITYNPLIQRGQKEKLDKEGNVILEDICSEKNIYIIAEQILKHNYFTDTLIVNVSECNINLINGNLSIIKDNNKSEINILDGQHRTKAILLCSELLAIIKQLEQNCLEEDAYNSKDIKLAKKIFNTGKYIKDLKEIKFPIQIETLPVLKAQTAFSQFAKGLKISSTRSNFFDNNNVYTIFIKDIIENTNLNGLVETIKDSIPKNSDKLVSFGTLYNSFCENFKEEELTPSLKEYMVNYFNSLLPLIKENKEENSMKQENITFYGYVSLAKTMYNKNTNKSLENILSSINFQKTSSTWYGKVLLEGKKGLIITNKKDTRKYISNLFSNKAAI